ncbi:glutathione S-transferase family protein [Neptuniibacter pectenicola]|jgi:glutathione S-transferase|uniref:glutathione S-transferase family protein n=1 Tax=Neptuniibacter pectenicola TaxID=1806669 RepID=UPI000835267D|nr:glutathione S-transferase family protein [Neptuniibacter pectenicola]
MYTLYGFPFSQHSRRVVSLLEETGLEYEFKNVDMMSGEHMSPTYLETNPNHQVPTLIADNVKIHESNAILRYLCNKHNLEAWYPQDADTRAAVDQWLDWIQCRLSPAVLGIVLNKVFMGEDADQDAIKQGQEKMVELSPLLENTFADSQFLCGEKPTIADLALVSNIFHLSLADELPTGESTRSWYKAMLEMDGVKKSLPEM